MREDTARRPWVVWLCAALMMLAPLACWSSDSAFITLTDTPVPTVTPTIQAFESLYAVGDTVMIRSAGLISTVYLTENPEPQTRRNRVAGGVCNAGTRLIVLAAAESDGATYYQIECNGVTGWAPEESLDPAGG